MKESTRRDIENGIIGIAACIKAVMAACDEEMEEN